MDQFGHWQRITRIGQDQYEMVYADHPEDPDSGINAFSVMLSGRVHLFFDNRFWLPFFYFQPEAMPDPADGIKIRFESSRDFVSFLPAGDMADITEMANIADGIFNGKNR